MEESLREIALFPNLNRHVDPADPATARKAALLRDQRFRQALSLAIHRERILATEYNGVGEPSQIEPGPGSGFHHPRLGKSFTDHDPARANRLLDELGLAARDGEGMRLFADGSRMSWTIDFTDFSGEGPAQFVVDDWAAVGIRARHRERSRPLFSTEKNSLVQDFTVWTGESEFNPLVGPRSFVPTYSESHHAPAYGRWYEQGGLYGLVTTLSESVQAPALGSPERQAMELLDGALAESDAARQKELVARILDLAAENVWTISIGTPPPALVAVKNGFRNVPRMAVAGAAYFTPANAGMETYFFDEPRDSPGAIAQMRREILEPNRGPDAVDAASLATDAGLSLARLLRRGFSLLALCLLAMCVFRHPYVGRRLAMMVPTLLVISVAGFVILQLPPGSYVETRMLELRMTGDEAAIEELERLAEMFHLEDPLWKQYTRWMGLHWFAGFDPADRGLLQGHLGRSMETGRTVNDTVGDRVALTFAVSLATILFTWLLALPIGIYSAVRPYSRGDYVATFLGFIGMSVPNFLLAILLMYWSGKYLGLQVTGLFSTEYAASPEWTWGKVADLLKHIWVPIVVIGTGGTAGMIRVMRGNLMDELRKPYVTTARAKGMRPFRLLMKYPVRLALNPFVSGIGGLFPQLVSGGAIVAIVLSLPLVGPVLLQGLMTQDIYLSGSMLVLLSLLGLVGTLASDLLLLALDPRIRLEGGGK